MASNSQGLGTLVSFPAPTVHARKGSGMLASIDSLFCKHSNHVTILLRLILDHMMVHKNRKMLYCPFPSLRVAWGLGMRLQCTCIGTSVFNVTVVLIPQINYYPTCMHEGKVIGLSVYHCYCCCCCCCCCCCRCPQK